MKTECALTMLGDAGKECQRKLDTMVFCLDRLLGQRLKRHDIDWDKVQEIVGRAARLEKEIQGGHWLSKPRPGLDFVRSRCCGRPELSCEAA